MTRNRLEVKVFSNREEIVDFKALADKISHGSASNILQDYQVPESQKPYLESVKQYRDLMSEFIYLPKVIEKQLDSPNTFLKASF